ncbi:hypothetical protein A3L09_10600 (plasmid) [Thermococcus profundus]|uniref:Uncharacterized protein n=1 Tax=Thermococcus profundus TaxID=49899 RepID=A0A2Z2MB01_THEPR|nr:hypothetical protein [Thermococcus profundus]ASJ03800.1 hypothetical protein A3L09_10600 [Thermococcus profundus]
MIGTISTLESVYVENTALDLDPSHGTDTIPHKKTIVIMNGKKVRVPVKDSISLRHALMSAYWDIYTKKMGKRRISVFGRDYLGFFMTKDKMNNIRRVLPFYGGDGRIYVALFGRANDPKIKIYEVTSDGISFTEEGTMFFEPVTDEPVMVTDINGVINEVADYDVFGTLFAEDDLPYRKSNYVVTSMIALPFWRSAHNIIPNVELVGGYFVHAQRIHLGGINEPVSYIPGSTIGPMDMEAYKERIGTIFDTLIQFPSEKYVFVRKANDAFLRRSFGIIVYSRIGKGYTMKAGPLLYHRVTGVLGDINNTLATEKNEKVTIAIYVNPEEVNGNTKHHGIQRGFIKGLIQELEKLEQKYPNRVEYMTGYYEDLPEMMYTLKDIVFEGA